MRAQSVIPLLVPLALPGLGGCLGLEPLRGDRTAQGTNEAPSAPEIAITPGSPVAGEPLRVKILAESIDPDGDKVTYLYQWYADDITQSDLAEGAVPSGTTTRYQTWRVEVTPTDGRLEGDPAEDSVFVETADPAVTVTLSPATAGTDDTITAVVDTSDLEGENPVITFAWTVDSVLVGEATEATLNGVQYFDRGQTVVAEVTVVDPIDDTIVVASDPLVVANTAPGDPKVAIDPTEPVDHADLLCRVTRDASDADRDAVSYTVAWTVDGASFTDTETTTWPDDTVPADATTTGEGWECTVTAWDDSDEGGSGSASAEIVPWPGEVEFETCGATGSDGPSQAQCDTAYSGTTLEGDVRLADGVQAWEVPFTADYVIIAAGSQGAGAQTGRSGGKGATVEGTFSLTGGDVLYIAVGQIGTGEDSGSNGGGGGGTWVMAADDSPLVVAGGGGGARDGASTNGCGGRAGYYGGTGTTTSSSSCPAKTTSLGLGGKAASTWYGSGGGGYTTDGGDTSSYGAGGKSWANGLTGGVAGTNCYTAAHGGFGGGGAGNGCAGGGGGGGFSGGDGGWIAGGGGSFNGGDHASWTADDNEGDGWVIIDLAE